MAGWTNIGAVLALLCGAAVVGGSVRHFSGSADHDEATESVTTNVRSDCRIKGNISIDDGQRIYHVPGQRYYAATRIDIQHGERWFCSEADAQAAGWRKALR